MLSFGLLINAGLFFLGFLLLFGGLKALFGAKADSYDRKSTGENILVALIMIAAGLFLTYPVIKGLFAVSRLFNG